jgi:hypothetical protein
MCLSAREQRQLDDIGEAVRRSDARLASMLVIFGRLAAREPMPEREKLPAPPGPVGSALRAAAAAAARLIAWLDRVDSPRPGHERLDGERRAA